MPKIINKNWSYGQKTVLAKKVGINESVITRLIAGECTVSRETCRKLELECKELGVPITFRDWINNKTTKNPYFGTGERGINGAEVYDAQVVAGAPEEKARLAAQAINEKNSGYKDLFHQNELDHKEMKNDFKLLKWMISFNMALCLGILIKLLL